MLLIEKVNNEFYIQLLNGFVNKRNYRALSNLLLS